MSNNGEGLPMDESEQRNIVCDALTEGIVRCGKLADEAGESFMLDLRKDRHKGEDDGSLTVRGLCRLLTSCDSGGRYGAFGEANQKLWRTIGTALGVAGITSLKIEVASLSRRLALVGRVAQLGGDTQAHPPAGAAEQLGRGGSWFDSLHDSPTAQRGSEPEAWGVTDKDGKLVAAWREQGITRQFVEAVNEVGKSKPYTLVPLFRHPSGAVTPTREQVAKLLHRMLGWDSLNSWNEHAPDHPDIIRCLAAADAVLALSARGDTTTSEGDNG